jgi:hypothetical protein
MNSEEFNSYYLKHSYGNSYSPISISSFPFPPSEIPEVLETNEFFIEQFGKSWALRHINNPFFIIPVWTFKKTIELPSVEADGTTDEKELTMFYVFIEGDPYSVGYRFGADTQYEERFFVEKSEIEADDIKSEYMMIVSMKPRLLQMHLAVGLATNSELMKSSQRTRESKFSNYLLERGLSPKGDLEAKVFKDNFGNNPFVLTDEEFEMIFGVER